MGSSQHPKNIQYVAKRKYKALKWLQAKQCIYYNIGMLVFMGKEDLHHPMYIFKAIEEQSASDAKCLEGYCL